MFGLFRKPSAAERAKADDIKAIVRERLALGEESTVSVSEIDCGDVDCPGRETVVLIMRPGARTRALKIRGPLLEVDPAMIEAAIAEQSDR